MTEPTLVACTACGSRIATSAEACPECGAANEYVDPRIREFIDNAANLDVREFNYRHTAHTISGEVDPARTTESIINVLGIVFLAFGCLARNGIAIALGLLCVAASIVMHLRSKGEPPAFSVDFSHDPPQWRSNDDRYWAPVKTALRIH